MTGTLHIVDQSPWEGEQLANCVAKARPGDRLLLVGEGVYGGGTAAYESWLQGASLEIAALVDDVNRTGMTLASRVSIIDAAAMVEWVVSATRSVSWRS